MTHKTRHEQKAAGTFSKSEYKKVSAQKQTRRSNRRRTVEVNRYLDRESTLEQET